MIYKLICRFCKKIIVESMEQEEIEKLGEWVQCPYCGNYSSNPDCKK